MPAVFRKAVPVVTTIMTTFSGLTTTAHATEGVFEFKEKERIHDCTYSKNETLEKSCGSRLAAGT